MTRAGKLDEAEPLYRKAVEIGESVLGPDHPDLATWLNNLATLVRDRGDLDAAEPLQRRALSIGEKVLGPAHPDLGAQIINLASLLAARGARRFCGLWRVTTFAQQAREWCLNTSFVEVLLAGKNKNC